MPKKLAIALVISGALIIIFIFAQSLSLGGPLEKDFSSDSIMMGEENAGGFAVPSDAGLPSASRSIPKLQSSAVLESNSAAVSPEGAPAPAEKKEIKNGNLTLKVDRTDEAAREIGAIAKANGGEVASSNFYQSADKVKSGSINVKVPVANFEKTFEEIKKVASLVVRESTTGTDVTREYTDLQSQLKNKQAEEQSILRLLERAGAMDDLLKVTRELNRVRGEIEMLQGQIRFMDSQTDLAQISVSLSEDPQIAAVDSWRPWQLVKDSVNNLIKGMQRFVDFAIVLVISVLPVLILYLVLVYVLYRIGKKFYLRWKAKREQSQK